MSKPKKIRGFALVEILVSVLLFSLGILALVSVQASSMQNTGEIQYRAEAMHMANAYISKIWADAYRTDNAGAGAANSPPTDPQTLINLYSGGGAEYRLFCQQIYGEGPFKGTGLPGAKGIKNNPQVTITNNSVTTTSTGTQINSLDVNVQIFWADQNGTTHNYMQTASIGY